MDSGLVASGYAEHLTDADIALLASAADARMTGATAAAQVRRLRRDPHAVVELLGDPRVFEAVFGDGMFEAVFGDGTGVAAGAPSKAVPAPPFLAFTVAVHRAAAELASMDHVPERSGPRQRVPLFDAPGLRDFLSSPVAAGEPDGITGDLTRADCAMALTGQHPGVGQPVEERLLRACSGGRGAHVPAQRHPGRLIPAAACSVSARDGRLAAVRSAGAVSRSAAPRHGSR